MSQLLGQSNDMKRGLYLELAWALVACAVAAPWIMYVIVEYINLDFWRDEMYTLDYFVFVPSIKILTDYQMPNNHIFSNLLNRIYTFVFGLDDIEIIQYPWKMRILMIFYTLVTFIFVYRIGKDFLGHLSGVLAIAVLGSTLPFLNFSVQVRGYSLSITLVSILMYYILRYCKEGRKRNALVILLATSTLIYTIPSNVYIVASIVVYWACVWSFLNWHNRRFLEYSHKEKNRIITIFVSIVAGGVIAVALYLPILSGIANNKYVMETYIKTSGFNVHTLTTLMPQSIGYIISYRWFLLIIIPYGFYLLFRDLLESKKYYLLIYFLSMPFSVVFPFVISFFRGDNPYDRVFIPIVVPFAIIGGITISSLIIRFSLRGKYIFFSLISIATAFSFISAVSYRDSVLLANLETGKETQNIMVNYYQKYYNPSLLMREFAFKYEEGGVFTTYGWIDRAAPRYMVHWMEIYGKSIGEWHKLLDFNNDDWFRQESLLYVLTNDRSFPSLFEERYPEFRCARITPLDQLSTIVRCNQKDRLDEPESTPDPPQPFVSSGRGWYRTEVSGAAAFRWGSADNTIWLANPYHATIQATLALTLGSFETTRLVELWDGQRLAARWEVQPLVRTYRMVVDIPPGYSRMRLRAPATYDPRSGRNLSVMALHMHIADYAVKPK